MICSDHDKILTGVEEKARLAWKTKKNYVLDWLSPEPHINDGF